MREPDSIDEKFVRFGGVTIDLSDSNRPIKCNSDGFWLSPREANARLAEAPDLAAAIAWYEARKAEGK